MRKIIFLSKDNLTANPRLKKELFLALDLGYEVTFVGFDLQNWTDDIETEVKQNLQKVKFVYLKASKKNFDLLWLISSIVELLSRKLYIFKQDSLALAAFAHSKRSFALWWWLMWHRKKYDLVVAHTLPTIYPAYKFSSRVGAKWTFDIEDYHPGETIPNDDKFEKQRRELLLKKLLPKTDAFTYASPLIGEQVLKLLSNQRLPLHTYVANSFPQSFFEYRQNNSQKIQFVWFSQNIAPRRGLELLVPALWEYRRQVELVLIGNLYNNFWKEFLSKYAEIIKILPPMPEDELYKKLCEYDVGCAIEMTKTDFNRDIALTNKIFAYAQAGLYILATDTRAQANFISQNPQLGVVVMQYLNDFQRKIEWIIEQKDEIRKGKLKRFELAKSLGWDNEKNKIIKLWSAILDV